MEPRGRFFTPPIPYSTKNPLNDQLQSAYFIQKLPTFAVAPELFVELTALTALHNTVSDIFDHFDKRPAKIVDLKNSIFVAFKLISAASALQKREDRRLCN